MRKLWLFFACFLLTVPLWGQNAAIEGHSFLGGTAAVTSGQNSTNYLNGIIPSATITVYLTGTTTLATIYSNASGTPLSNPFTSNALGSTNPGGYLFFAAINQGYDVVASGGIAPNTYPNPVTLCVDCYAGSQITPYQPITFQHNGTNLADQSLLNFNDTTPVAPAGDQNVTFASGANGELSGYVAGAGSQLQPNMVPPASGNYVVVYPTTVQDAGGGEFQVDSCNGNLSTLPAGASVVIGLEGGISNSCNVVFGGFTLPASVPANSVTAVYAFSTNTQSSFPYPGNRNITGSVFCTMGGKTTFLPPESAVSGGYSFNWPLGNYVSALADSTWDPTVTCEGSLVANEAQLSTASLRIDTIGLIVYSVDAPAPVPGLFNVVAPLSWNLATQSLTITSNPGWNLFSLKAEAMPPASFFTGQAVLVSDGSTPTDCSVGGGSNFVLCTSNGSTWSALSGATGATGTVTSVAATVPSWLTVTGSPVTASGTLAVTATTGLSANEFLATPNGATGAVGLRAIVAADIPTLNQSTTGNAATATAFAATPAQCSTGQFATGITAAGAANCATPSGSTTVSYGSASGCAFANDGNGLTCTGVTVTLSPAMPNTSYNAVCSVNYSNAMITTTSALPSLGLAWTVSSASTISVDEAVASGSSTGFGIASNYGVTVACTAIE